VVFVTYRWGVEPVGTFRSTDDVKLGSSKRNVHDRASPKRDGTTSTVARNVAANAE